MTKFMKLIPKFGALEWLFIPLIALTVAMWIHDRLPASADEIAAVRAIAASSQGARAEVAAAMATMPEMDKREIRELRERAAARTASASRSAGDPVAAEMARERDRLSAQSVTDMTPADLVRWALLASRRHLTLVLGGVIGVCAMLIVRRRECRRRVPSGNSK
ncbi:hypothetical protein BZL54_23030 [Burkholderia ubonensis subsp. mesacidophila]|uniref:Uncharacterized protein n=2 Tax=Burkholderia ubonensis TaxID=101571 RepID=A0A2A4F9I0_9BURK|nr:hypothetical protein BZL54_23030 [Burkholderia ubonensis subsp. mesacidophila]